MNHIAPMHEPAVRDIPLCRLVLAPENVRKIPSDEAAQAQLQASIAEVEMPRDDASIHRQHRFDDPRDAGRNLLRGHRCAQLVREDGGERQPAGVAFCGTCGTHVWACDDVPDPGWISIRGGTVRQREQLPPRHQIWCRSAQPWLGDIGSSPRAER